jgi:TonB family protein
MKTQSIRYGAVELQLAAQRYWMYGFVISMGMHCALLAALHLPGLRSVTLPQGIDHGTIILGGPPQIPWNPTIRPALPGPRTVQPRGQDGIPTPVPEEAVPAGKGLKAMGGLGEGVPGGEGEGEVSGSNEGHFGGEVDNETPPGPFVPYEEGPHIVRRVEPTYPDLAVKAELEGVAVARMWVDRQGKVREVQISLADNELFADAVREVARQWLFTPAIMNQQPVSVWVSVTFKFRLPKR